MHGCHLLPINPATRKDSVLISFFNSYCCGISNALCILLKLILNAYGIPQENTKTTFAWEYCNFTTCCSVTLTFRPFCLVRRKHEKRRAKDSDITVQHKTLHYSWQGKQRVVAVWSKLNSALPLYSLISPLPPSSVVKLTLDPRLRL